MLGRQPVAKGLNPISLRGMVARGKEVDAHLPRHMDGLLGRLTGQEGIDPLLSRQTDETLSTATAPGNPADQATTSTWTE